MNTHSVIVIRNLELCPLAITSNPSYMSLCNFSVAQISHILNIFFFSTRLVVLFFSRINICTIIIYFRFLEEWCMFTLTVGDTYQNVTLYQT